MINTVSSIIIPVESEMRERETPLRPACSKDPVFLKAN